MFQIITGCVSNLTAGRHETSVCTFGSHKILQTPSIDSGTRLSQSREVIPSKDFAYYSCFGRIRNGPATYRHLSSCRCCRSPAWTRDIVYGSKALAQKLTSNNELTRSPSRVKNLLQHTALNTGSRKSRLLLAISGSISLRKTVIPSEEISHRKTVVPSKANPLFACAISDLARIKIKKNEEENVVNDAIRHSHIHE